MAMPVRWKTVVASLWRDDSGSIAIMFGLLGLLLFAVAGFAIDYTRATSLEDRIRQSLDAAVLAGLKAAPGESTEVAEHVFAANMGDFDLQSVKVSFSSPEKGQLTGTASAVMPTHLAAVVGVDNMQINANATGAVNQPGRVCIMALDSSVSQALLVNSGAEIDAPDCEIHVHSKANPAAIFNSGTTLDTKRICIKSSSIIDNGGSHPNTYAPCEPAADPYAGKFPEPANTACDYSNLNFNGGTVKLTPGVYCGWVNFNSHPDVTLAPGTYVIKNGGWNVDGGTWTGDRVTFYFGDTSKIQFNSAVKAKLTPPTSGNYENVIITEKPGLAKSAFVLDDSRGFDIQGIVYLPSRDTIVNGGSSIESRSLSVVVNTLILDETKWRLDSSASQVSGSASNEAPRLIR